jgi:hydroxymethylbilane synthase
MRGLVGNPDGQTIYRSERSGELAHAETIGRLIAEDLLKQGADKILQTLYA